MISLDDLYGMAAQFDEESKRAWEKMMREIWVAAGLNPEDELATLAEEAEADDILRKAALNMGQP